MSGLTHLILTLLTGFLAQTPYPPVNRPAGLIKFPEIFSTEPCEPFIARAVAVYSEPSEAAQRLGAIEVLNPWKTLTECPPLNVRFLRNGRPEPFPTLEIDYEQPAAVVFERRERWFRIKLEYGSGWVLRQEPDETELFTPYLDLLKDNLTYIPQGWDRRLFELPEAGAALTLPPEWRLFLSGNIPVTVLENRMVGEALWLHIRFDSEAGCGSIPTDLPAVEGWLPAYGSSGDPSVWFYSRGC